MEFRKLKQNNNEFYKQKNLTKILNKKTSLKSLTIQKNLSSGFLSTWLFVTY